MHEEVDIQIYQRKFSNPIKYSVTKKQKTDKESSSYLIDKECSLSSTQWRPVKWVRIIHKWESSEGSF